MNKTKTILITGANSGIGKAATIEIATGYAYLATAVELNNVTGTYFDEKMKPVKPGKYAR